MFVVGLKAIYHNKNSTSVAWDSSASGNQTSQKLCGPVRRDATAVFMFIPEDIIYPDRLGPSFDETCITIYTKWLLREYRALHQ